MCNENDKINLSFWNIERIQREQDKHKLGSLYIPVVDKDCFKECDLEAMDSMTSAIDKFMEKYQEENELYIICELAKRYVESQVPAEWERVDGYGGLYVCTNCGENTTETAMGKPRFNYCPNCGRRMKNGTDL